MMEVEAKDEFKLSSSLSGHDDQIRDVSFIDNDTIAVTAFAGQVAVWVREDDTHFGRLDVFREKVHPGLIFCVERVPTHVNVPGLGKPHDSAFVTGGNDNIARFWTTHGTIVGELKGHNDCVNSVSFTPSGEILTGSWDGTVRVWKDGVNVHTFRGHQNATEVCALSTGEIIIASTNMNIEIIRDGVVQKTINKAHGRMYWLYY